MDSKIELSKKKILDLENVKSQLHAFSLFQEKEILLLTKFLVTNTYNIMTRI
jgi:hypothetical protein